MLGSFKTDNILSMAALYVETLFDEINGKIEMRVSSQFTVVLGCKRNGCTNLIIPHSLHKPKRVK